MKQRILPERMTVRGDDYFIYRLRRLEEQGLTNLDRLPFSIRVLLENLLRKMDQRIITFDHLKTLAEWHNHYDHPREIAFYPARVLMQDFTGVPGLVDLAAMRDTMAENGKDPSLINPLLPVDLVVDHSLQVDYFGDPQALSRNLALEYKRNGERYAFLKWAQKAFRNMRVIPPGAGIVHQVNLEFLARVVMTTSESGQQVAFPDTLVGTDSHTTMINALGVLGWGVGGIEAEAVMLGQPYFMKIPEVIGFKLVGSLGPGTTATDLVLTITEILRKNDVIDKFVEFFGPGIKTLTVPDRATIANMAPEYGATMGFFPVDQRTLDYLAFTNRADSVPLVEAYSREQKLFFEDHEAPDYTKVIELDLAHVRPSVAGPARPQDRIPIELLGTALPGQKEWRSAESGEMVTNGPFEAVIGNRGVWLDHGSVVIAAITSCTNTSNPTVLVGAGLLAKAAVEKGLSIGPAVKTSFAPGSKVVLKYLQKAGLMTWLEQLGFHVVGFGCTTCIGNSGPLVPEVEELVKNHGLNVSAVLSGNRNFEARIHPLVRSNYLMSPLLVVAYALAGRTNIDLTREPLGRDLKGADVFLGDIWPSPEEIGQVIKACLEPEMFAETYKTILDGDTFWQNLDITEEAVFHWPGSLYIQKPPFFAGFQKASSPVKDIIGANVLAVLGDSVTTDHISPAGTIPEKSPAGHYLMAHNVAPPDFNSYGSRRGNHEVMVRGTFANVRIKNLLVKPKEGGLTLLLPEKTEMSMFDAGQLYARRKRDLIILAGKEYGTGSSRDWAAKGTLLLGVKAVIAESFERIHRNNLIGMGVLPLQFMPGESWKDLELSGTEEFTIKGTGHHEPGQQLEVIATDQSNHRTTRFTVISRLDTDVDKEYFLNGGILLTVLRKMSE